MDSIGFMFLLYQKWYEVFSVFLKYLSPF